MFQPYCRKSFLSIFARISLLPICLAAAIYSILTAGKSLKSTAIRLHGWLLGLCLLLRSRHRFNCLLPVCYLSLVHSLSFLLEKPAGCVLQGLSVLSPTYQISGTPWHSAGHFVQLSQLGLTNLLLIYRMSIKSALLEKVFPHYQTSDSETQTSFMSSLVVAGIMLETFTKQTHTYSK